MDIKGRNDNYVWQRSSIIPYCIIFCNFSLLLRKYSFVRPRSAAQFDRIDLYAGFDIVIIFVTIGFLFFVPWKNIFNSISKTSFQILIIYYLLCTISAFWSENILYSGYRAIEALSQILSILALVSYFIEKKQSTNWLIFLALISILLNISMNIRLSGLQDFHTNSFTASSAMLFCYLFGNFFTEKANRFFVILIMLFCLIFIFLGTSAASNISICIGLLAIFCLRPSFFVFYCFILFSLIFIFYIGIEDIYKILFPGKNLEAIENLTGRVKLWSLYFEVFKERWFLGHGFAIINRKLQFYATNAHNSLIASLIGTGIIGLTLYLWFSLRCGLNMLVIIRAKTSHCIGLTSAIIVGLANSMSLAFIGEQWMAPSYVFYLFLAILAFSCKKARLKQTEDIF